MNPETQKRRFPLASYKIREAVKKIFLGESKANDLIVELDQAKYLSEQRLNSAQQKFEPIQQELGEIYIEMKSILEDSQIKAMKMHKAIAKYIEENHHLEKENSLYPTMFKQYCQSICAPILNGERIETILNQPIVISTENSTTFMLKTLGITEPETLSPHSKQAILDKVNEDFPFPTTVSAKHPPSPRTKFITHLKSELYNSSKPYDSHAPQDAPKSHHKRCSIS